MKAIKLASGLIFVAAMGFTACDSDRDYNPMLDDSNLPSTFTLNTPAYSTQSINLKKSTSLHFSWSQPEYGFPVVTTYTQQISLTNTWKDAVTDANGLETQPATYYNLEGSGTTVSRDVDARNFAKGMTILAGWADENSLPDTTMTVYVRCLASVGADANGKVTSNVVAIKVLPYYVSPVSYPSPWYLTGEGINGWMGSDGAPANETTIPFDLNKESADGSGVMTKTIYLNAGIGFKCASIANKWDKQVGGSFDAPVWNDGGSSDLSAPADGYYELALDEANSKFTAKKVDIDETAHPVRSSVTLTGTGMANGDVAMIRLGNTGHSHIWYATDVPLIKATVSFNVDGTTYSDGKFPYGWTSTSSAAIPTVKGTFTVYYDDLSGCYQFYAK